MDALEAVPTAPFAGMVWRSVRAGRDPLVCGRPGGRWDDGTLDVLYTSETREGAVAERRFHLFQGQPFPPSRVRYDMFELCVSLGAVMRFTGLEALADAGLRVAGYGRLSYLEREQEYPRTQEIAGHIDLLPTIVTKGLNFIQISIASHYLCNLSRLPAINSRPMDSIAL